ncbi:hypothetical protein [Cupriavidus pauculus]|uniref:hypothetical protein n=1 Tax=Cupriavidus pauculus TaxID=82633 RepID=UPI001EE2831E|nr:hypothetical protein [Cupriavidus pauculus]GJG95995.1 hypothetical protein CBA19C6_15920 [Cupriavidus pauculus]
MVKLVRIPPAIFTGSRTTTSTKESGEMLTIGACAPHSIAIATEFPEGSSPDATLAMHGQKSSMKCASHAHEYRQRS